MPTPMPPLPTPPLSLGSRERSGIDAAGLSRLFPFPIASINFRDVSAFRTAASRAAAAASTGFNAAGDGVLKGTRPNETGRFSSGRPTSLPLDKGRGRFVIFSREISF